MDHSGCKVTQTTGQEEHVCLPCPHGLERGGTFTLTGIPRIDDKQRQLKMLAIDRSSCDDYAHAHAEALRCAPMKLSAEARRLLDRQPTDKDGMCIHCERVPRQGGHARDCAWWLPHARILAAIDLIDKLARTAVWTDPHVEGG
jgi:hypothetical protein